MYILRVQDMESDSEAFGKSNRSSSSQEREIISSQRKSSSSSSARSRSSRMGRETEEEAIIRRFHDAQRMARFRARKKKALEDKQMQQQQPVTTKDSETELRLQEAAETESKYTQLLAIIERIGRDVRLSYAGSRSSAERLKSGIVRARGLVRDCLIETRINLRQ